MKLSIIIVSYNTRELLRECLSSLLYWSEGLACEVIVVDNASDDGSEGMVRAEFPTVQVIQSGSNLGFGRANNLGLQQARGEYVWFLNSDTRSIHNAARVLCDYLDQHPDAGAVGGNLLDADQQAAHSFGPLHNVWWELADLLPTAWKRSLRGPYSTFNYDPEPRRVGYLSGADLMVRRALVVPVGFDPDFFMYYEDMELCHRIRRAGYRIVSVPRARVIHLAGQSNNVSAKKLQMLLESKYTYYAKTHGERYARMVYLLLQAGYSIHVLIGQFGGDIEKRRQYNTWRMVNEIAWEHHSAAPCRD